MATIPDHRYERPAQIHADMPAPNECSVCGQPDYTHPTEEDEQLAALRLVFPGWWIGPAPFSGWRAEWKSPSGLSIHYVGGNSLEDLHKRLETVEAARAELTEDIPAPNFYPADGPRYSGGDK